MTTTVDPRDGPTATVPACIESSQGKLVYLYLSAHGEQSIDELANALAVRKLGLFDVIRSLETHGLVERDRPEKVRFVG